MRILDASVRDGNLLYQVVITDGGQISVNVTDNENGCFYPMATDIDSINESDGQPVWDYSMDTYEERVQ